MKRKTKYVLVVLLVAVIAAVVYGYMEYNRRPADLSGVDSRARISADSLAALYQTDENTANSLYLGKPIEVTGQINEISNQQDTAVTVFLGTDEMHRVSCLVSSNQLTRIKQYKAGDLITVKGICTGYLLDVELNRCVVVR